MFGASVSKPPASGGRRPRFKWWIVVLILVVGFPLMVLQTVPLKWQSATPQQQPDLTPTAPTQEPGASEERGFLAEYQSDVIPSLEEQGGPPLATAEEQDPSWLGVLDVVAKLALVVGLVYLAVAGLRWLEKGRRGQADAGGTTIRLLETVGLAPGRSLHLVVAGDKTLLIGATDHHLSLLTELSAASAPLGEDVTAFEDVLCHQSAPPQDSRAAESVEWRVAVERLRTGVQEIRQAFGGGGSEPTA